jgi:cytochrome c556
MTKIFKQLLAITLGTTLAAAAIGVAFAQQGPKPEQLIKWRQSAYQVIAWNSGRIKASLDGNYNKEEVVRSANTIATLSNAGIGSLFAPGTETGKGWKDTAAKPELFKDAQKAGELNANFVREANELARVAAAGDAAAVKTQYAKLNGTCKGCHDEFRSKD